MACLGGRVRPGVSWRAAAALLLLAGAACSPADRPHPSAEVQPSACQTPGATPTPSDSPSPPASSARDEASRPRESSPSPTPPSLPPFTLPTSKGINYGTPRGADGRYLGTRRLRPGDPGWASARPALAADLDFVAANDLGRVLRVFIGLDQAMVWDAGQGFVRFDPAALSNFDDALGM